MRKCTLYILFILCLSNRINAQIFLKAKELEKYALDAKDTSKNYFVVYLNGDTLKGTSFTKKQIKGKSQWALGDSIIAQESIHSYQDENGYFIINSYTEKTKWYKILYGEKFIRLFNGKVSLFASQVVKKEIGRAADSEVTTIDNYNKKSTTYSRTFFFISKNPNALDRMQPITPKLLEELISDYPPAVEKLKQEFKKINDKETNDYNAIIAVLQVYNKKK